MNEQKIEPHRVTRPIQLLAAWLVGLIVTNGSFLGAAAALPTSSWERGALVVAAIANVPIFLAALFLLQTRFRAELQEDSFYAEYLSKKTAAVVRIDKDSAQDSRLDGIERAISHLAQGQLRTATEAFAAEGGRVRLDWDQWSIGLNKFHPRLSELREAFREAGVPVGDIFGSMQAPDKWIISLAYYLPAKHKAQILRIALPFGFDGFLLWEPQRDADESEDAYVGSYGDNPYARVTTELTEVVREDMEAADLAYYYSEHKTQG